MKWSRLVVLLPFALGFACKTEMSAAEAGKDKFNSPDGFSKSTINTVSCATCHQTEATPDPNRRDAGYNLYGVAARESWWGGNEIRLLDAVDICLVYFMRGPASGLDRDSDEAKQLYEYLLSITPDNADSTPLPFTVVENITCIPGPGDPVNGEKLYQAACQQCHGEVHTGRGSITEPMDYILPEFTDGYDTVFPGIPHGLVVIEKIRHGRFFGVGGTMGLMSTESITDPEIADILAFLGLSCSM